MKSYKYSKTEVHQVLVKVLRNAAGKKKKQTNKQTNKEDEEGEIASRCHDEENLTDIE